MLSMMMFAALTINQTPVEGSTLYVPRTELRQRVVSVPRVVHDEVVVNEAVTVYDRYKTVLVPDGTVGPFQTSVNTRRGFFSRRPSVVETFKYRLRRRGY